MAILMIDPAEAYRIQLRKLYSAAKISNSFDKAIKYLFRTKGKGIDLLITEKYDYTYDEEENFMKLNRTYKDITGGKVILHTSANYKSPVELVDVFVEKRSPFHMARYLLPIINQCLEGKIKQDISLRPKINPKSTFNWNVRKSTCERCKYQYTN